jgi:hypothetical protein
MHYMAQELEEWLQEAARFCNRYHLRMTESACQKNRRNTLDLRCEGCPGLEDQERKLVRAEPVVFFSDPEPDAPITLALAEALQEVLDDKDDESLDEVETEESCLDLQDPEGLGFGLLAFMEEEYEEIEPPRRPKPDKTPQRYAVFMGRCPRCKGYMVNAPERHGHSWDYGVHRCFNCGERVSPAYAWNRDQVA